MSKKTPVDQDVVTPLQTSHTGIALGVLIVLLIIILGGLYLKQQSLENKSKVLETPSVTRPTASENNEPESTNAEADVETLGVMSTSNEIDAIEADVESTPIQDIDADLQNIAVEIAQ